MRVPVQFPIEEIVPHSGPMCLIGRAVEGDADSMVCELTIDDSGLFCTEQGVGAWVGLEYMAQTVAAWSGWHARLSGTTPKLGFLVGARRYDCKRQWFAPGETLRIEVVRGFEADNGLAAFECRIEIEGQEVASTQLKVFEPREAGEFLDGEGLA